MITVVIHAETLAQLRQELLQLLATLPAPQKQ
jgi:hypothetical protein